MRPETDGNANTMTRIGVISDTHGYLNPKVFDVFAEVQYILHAGDVGDDRILDELETIAPTHAISGNVDGIPIARRPVRFSKDIAGVRVCMTHGHLLDSEDYNLSAYRMFETDKPRAIVHGHTHVAKNKVIADVLFLNPGAACKPRFKDIPSVAILEIETSGDIFVRFVEL
jgi:putative phosphoesterase